MARYLFHRAPHLESESQHGSAVKAANTLERFCPIEEHGSGIGDCDDGGGIILKRIKARPRWRDCVDFRRPGRAMLNSA